MAAGANQSSRRVVSPLRDGVAYLPATVIPALASVAGGAIFTRLFPPHSYGILVLVGAVTAPVVTVLSQLLGQPTGRYYHELDGAGLGQVHGAVLSKFVEWIGLLTVLTAAASATGLVLAIPNGITWVSLVVAAVFGMGIRIATATILPILSMTRDITGHRTYHVGSAIVGLLVPLALVVSFGRHVLWMVWGGTLSGFVMGMFLAHRVGRHRKLGWILPSWTPAERAVLQRMLRYGGPMAIWFFAAAVIQSTDRYVIAASVVVRPLLSTPRRLRWRSKRWRFSRGRLEPPSAPRSSPHGPPGVIRSRYGASCGRRPTPTSPLAWALSADLW